MNGNASTISGSLSQAAAIGCGLSFEEQLRTHQAMVLSLARNFLRDTAQAEELAQDVFLQLYRHQAAIQSPAHLVFWLRQVTSRRCIDAVRQRRPAVSLESIPEPSLPARPGDPFLSRRLQRLVAGLPEVPRLVMLLRYQEDLDPAEIAGVLELPLGTVKSHLQRSLVRLRAALNPAEAVPPRSTA
ncbi:MAG: RNA polymerase sigma factor [Terriglobales bacterium]